MADTPKDASQATAALHAEILATLPFSDIADFEESRRGFIAGPDQLAILGASGSKVWDLAPYAFLDSETAPETVNPSLWRMARLNMAHGLFEVVPRVFQLRGLDLANITIVEGDTGLIVIDTLTTVEVARAAMALYFEHRPARPVRAVIYTHSHSDHFGGVRGVVSQEQVNEEKVEIWAPDGFMEAVGGENVLPGNAMARRAQFQFGGLLRQGPRGQVDAGLGKITARGSQSLIAPTRADPGIGSRPTASTASNSSFSSPRKPRRRPRCTSSCRSSACSTWPRTQRTTCIICCPCAAPWCAIR